MEVLPRFSNRLFSLSSNNPTSKSLITPFLHFQFSLTPTSSSKPISVCPNPFSTTHFLQSSKPLISSSSSSTFTTRAGWLLGLGKNKQQKLPDLVQAGDPVLHEPARVLDPKEIGSDSIQKIIDDMINVMRLAPGVGLAAPQIGVPLKVIVNPVLKKKSNRTALFFEGCLSVDGYRAVVERYLDVEVRGLDRFGQPVKVDASGWQARILQHECDHLEGTLYVDKMQPRTFRIVDNLDLPLATGCPKLGPC